MGFKFLPTRLINHTTFYATIVCVLTFRTLLVSSSLPFFNSFISRLINYSSNNHDITHHSTESIESRFHQYQQRETQNWTDEFELIHPKLNDTSEKREIPGAFQLIQDGFRRIAEAPIPPIDTTEELLVRLLTGRLFASEEAKDLETESENDENDEPSHFLSSIQQDQCSSGPITELISICSQRCDRIWLQHSLNLETSPTQQRRSEVNNIRQGYHTDGDGSSRMFIEDKQMLLRKSHNYTKEKDKEKNINYENFGWLSEIESLHTNHNQLKEESDMISKESNNNYNNQKYHRNLLPISRFFTAMKEFNNHYHQTSDGSSIRRTKSVQRRLGPVDTHIVTETAVNQFMELRLNPPTISDHSVSNKDSKYRKRDGTQSTNKIGRKTNSRRQSEDELKNGEGITSTPLINSISGLTERMNQLFSVPVDIATLRCKERCQSIINRLIEIPLNIHSSDKVGSNFHVSICENVGFGFKEYHCRVSKNDEVEIHAGLLERCFG